MPGQLGVSKGSHFLEGRDLVLICAALNVLYLPNLLKTFLLKIHHSAGLVNSSSE